MIELYGCGSPNVFKVIAMLAETGLEFRLIEVDLYSDPPGVDDLGIDNWNGKLPVLVDHAGFGDKPHTVVESGAILIYLAEKTGQLLPDDPSVRSEALQWLMFQMSSIGPMFGQALHFRYIATEGNDYARSRYQTEVERLYDILDRRLCRVPYLAGQQYSIADVAAYPWVARYPKTLGIALAHRHGVTAWIERVASRPAQQQVDGLCKTLFRATLDAQAKAAPGTLDRFFGRVSRSQH